MSVFDSVGPKPKRTSYPYLSIVKSHNALNPYTQVSYADVLAYVEVCEKQLSDCFTHYDLSRFSFLLSERIRRAVVDEYREREELLAWEAMQ